MTKRRPRPLWLVPLATIALAMVMVATPGAAHPGGAGPLVDVYFTATATNDDGGGGDGDDGGGPLYDAWGAASSADPSAPGPGAPRVDKDVARCSAGMRAADHQYVDVVVENAYPGYVCTFTSTVLNGTGLPVDVFAAVLNADPGLRVAAASPQLPTPMAPGSRDTAFSVEVLQAAAQGTTLHATVAIDLLVETGRIIIDKVTVPAGSPQQFTFHPSWGRDVTLTDAAPPYDSGLLPAGVYSLAEVAPAGWELASAVCSDGSDINAIGVSGDEVVTCTFTNRRLGQPGHILVDKAVWNPTAANVNTRFGFDPSWGEDFLLSGADEPYDSGPLEDGTYSLAEVNLPAEWALRTASCAVAGGRAMDPSAITVGWGDEVVCTFENLDSSEEGPVPGLTVVKEALPADDTEFAFDGGSLGRFTLADPSGPKQEFPNLPAGEYTITELDAEGFELMEIECLATDWEVDGNSVTVNLLEGEAALCTFRNAQLPYTGAPGWVTPLAGGGFVALLLGFLVLVLAGRRRREEDSA